jgi:cytosine deaminase
MPLDLVIANARLADRDEPVDIGVRDGVVAEIAANIAADAPREDAAGSLAFGGFVESHIHLDKACILDRCTITDGTLAEAIALTAAAKAAFTVEDVYARAARVMEMAILHGTTHMRSFVEVDPRAGFRSFEALLRVRTDYAFAVDLQICAFAQEGLTNEPETADMLARALEAGADMVGGCPYTDPDPVAHVSATFDIAERYGVPVDFHSDFDLDPDRSILPEIISETETRAYGGRVSVGHVTKLSAMAPENVADLVRRLADAGVAVAVLPATDLFLTGRGADRLIPRGVAPAALMADQGVVVSLASNNILNPFTPFGDGSLIRVANLFANVAHLARDKDIAAVFDMVTGNAARQLGVPFGLAVGSPADVVLIDAPDPVSAVRKIAPVAAGWKRGRKSFVRERAQLLRPAT